jgi:hypothetical protein
MPDYGLFRRVPSDFVVGVGFVLYHPFRWVPCDFAWNLVLRSDLPTDMFCLIGGSCRAQRFRLVPNVFAGFLPKSLRDGGQGGTFYPASSLGTKRFHPGGRGPCTQRFRWVPSDFAGYLPKSLHDGKWRPRCTQRLRWVPNDSTLVGGDLVPSDFAGYLVISQDSCPSHSTMGSGGHVVPSDFAGYPTIPPWGEGTLYPAISLGT